MFCEYKNTGYTALINNRKTHYPMITAWDLFSLASSSLQLQTKAITLTEYTPLYYSLKQGISNLVYAFNPFGEESYHFIFMEHSADSTEMF
jgi:hypothetical protein